MKLSLWKKFGHIHIRAGRLLHVAHDHQVTTNTMSVLEDDEFKGTLAGSKWVTAKVGDLALEIVSVATGKALGYGYLTGDAVRLNLYRSDVPLHWFAPAKALCASTVQLADNIGKLSPDEVLKGIMAMKYADAQVVTLSIHVEHQDDLKAAMDVLTGGYRYVPSTMTDEQARSDPKACHVIGIAMVGKPRALGKQLGAFGVMHMQPPRDATKFGCSPFHALMLATGTWDVIDPWSVPAQAAG